MLNKLYVLVVLCFLLADDVNFSVQSPVLVNRGWVPRSWRDKALESSQDVEEAKDLSSTASSTGEKHYFWRFWSKTPLPTEVCFALLLLFL